MAKPDDLFSRLEFLIGLPNVRVLSVDRVRGVLEIHLDTAEPNRFCRVCGIAGVVRPTLGSRRPCDRAQMGPGRCALSETLVSRPSETIPAVRVGRANSVG